MQGYSYLNQDAAVKNMIESSLYRCANDLRLESLEIFHKITREDVERCQNHVTGHIRLMRKSSPGYYEQQNNILAVNNACLMYTHPNFDIFGRYGNVELKKELKSKNICVGANLGENVVGTNAAVIATRSQSGVWLIGDDNYSAALKPYACYAFQIHARYSRNGIIMLVTPIENMSEKIFALFKLIESTENIITTGSAAEDVKIKELAMNNKYNKLYTDNIMLIVGISGIITYANDMFCDVYNTNALSVISVELGRYIPELIPIFEQAKSEHTPISKDIFININGNVAEYTVEATPIDNHSQFVGCIMTMSKSGNKVIRTGKSGNVAKYTFDDLKGMSDVFVQLKSYAERIARTSSSVLVQGESGTGKELFAHAIHYASERRSGPFVAINCAAIPKELIGSELFGYVGGSFTGASKTGAKGKFELADKGTLFLDEIGEMPLEMQSVLLRVLEDSTVTRVGAATPNPVDVRLITATNRDLMSYVKEGKFRADLYYRLNVINLVVMPLREHKSDIPVLVEAFMKKSAQKNNMQIFGIRPEAMKALIEYDWPGNIRELKNIIERGVVTSKNGYIDVGELPYEIGRMVIEPADKKADEQYQPDAGEKKISPLPELMAIHRHEIALKLLEENGGNRTKVAELMGVSRSTLYRILKDVNGELSED
ncbi:MAG: AAA family ATPase [Bacteroidia bacterium]|nr:AAA family ATPase [Bacteroidia bacterium]